MIAEYLMSVEVFGYHGPDAKHDSTCVDIFDCYYYGPAAAAVVRWNRDVGNIADSPSDGR